MAQRIAFLIANQKFRPDSGLAPLRGPLNDVAALSNTLGDPSRGGFDVRTFVNATSGEVKAAIDEELGNATQGDLVLIHYAGHGKLDRYGALCLATSDTRASALQATSIPTRHIKDFVANSDCNSVILSLDCCYSGAATHENRGDLESQLISLEDTSGFYILSASSDIQTASELEVDGIVLGRFTASLLEGINTGAADHDEDGRILLHDIFRYIRKNVKHQTPRLFAASAGGDPLISLSPATELRKSLRRQAEAKAEQDRQDGLRRQAEAKAEQDRQDELRRQAEAKAEQDRQSKLRVRRRIALLLAFLVVVSSAAAVAGHWWIHEEQQRKAEQDRQDRQDGLRWQAEVKAKQDRQDELRRQAEAKAEQDRQDELRRQAKAKADQDRLDRLRRDDPIQAARVLLGISGPTVQRKWSIGACNDPTKTYTAEVVNSYLKWTARDGGLDSESIDAASEESLQTTTAKSEHPNGSNENVGTKWAYSSSASGRIQVRRNGVFAFWLNRC